jgi:hypothetical protein
MATSGMSALLMPFFIFLLAGSSAAAMDRLRWQVDSVTLPRPRHVIRRRGKRAAGLRLLQPLPSHSLP